MGFALVLTLLSGSPAAAGPATEWPAYLNNPRHSSRSASTAITPANAGALVKAFSRRSRGDGHLLVSRRRHS